MSDDTTTKPLDIVASANIGGVKTNRVKVKRPRQMNTPGSVMVQFRKDPSTKGLAYACIAVSIPAEDLALIDEACERLKMARSHLLREAAKRFIARAK